LAPIGIAVATDRRATRIIGNRACEAILETPLGSNLANSGEQGSALLFRVFHDGVEVPPAELPVQIAAMHGKAIAEELYEHRFHDGRVKSVLVSAVPLRDEAGESRGAVAALVDVTEQRRMAAALAATAQQKDEFITLLAHELRNPMAAIATSLEVLAHKKAVSPAGQRSLGILQRQVAQLGKLVDDLLDASRIARRKVALRREPVELTALVESAVDDQQAQAEQRRIELSFVRCGDALWVHGDKVRLNQVVTNLLSNALKFTREGGSVEVSVGVASETGAKLVVRDTGIGIARETLASIFEPFRRDVRRDTEVHAGGLGLGLALSKGLVDLHGGTIIAHSDGPGTGATFEVELPRVAAPATTHHRDDEPQPETARRVLVVEDGEDLAQSLLELLESHGHQAGVASTGREALAIASELRPEVVICDIGLPGDLDGYEVARRLRADPRLSEPFLIALTGFAADADRKRATEAGFDLHLAKPPNMKALEKLVARGRPER
jgi:signal transduction histidine kinase/ActR/RegA family two-component response regulator